MKAFSKNISLLVFGIIISFILIECFFRIMSFIGASNLPKINEKAFRILCVGDSSTYGLGVKNPNIDSYPTIMQKLFDNENIKAQVINLGLPGVNSTQALNNLKENINKISPHLIIVCIGVNDMWNFENSNVFNYYKTKNIPESIKLFFRKLISNFKIVRFIKLNFISQSKENTKFYIPNLDLKIVQKNDKIMPDVNEQIYAISKNLRENLQGFKDEAEKRKVKIIFLEYHAPGWRNPEVLIHEFYKELNLSFVPLYKIFEKLDNENIPIRSNDKWHPNERGYQIIAENVFNYIKNNNYLTYEPKKIDL